MKLYCVRHGEALCAPDDSARPLSERGLADITKMARHLHHCGVKPGHIMHSPRVRAVQTAQIMASILGVEHVTQCDNGLDGIDPVAQITEQVPHWHDDTMLVGHLPFMSKLVSALVMHEEDHAMVNFAAGSVVCLDEYEQHRWIVNWLLRPSMVCDVAGNHPESMY
jgi:phosphohistidine phosphatase